MNITMRNVRPYASNIFNKKQLLTGSNFKYYPSSTSSIPKIICRTEIARPKEMDMLKERYRERQERIEKLGYKKGTDNDDGEEIGPYAIFLLGIPVLTFALGCWQIYRRQWKLALLADLNERTSAEPVELPYDLSELKSMDYRPVTVRGTFLYDREFVITPKSLIINGAGVSEGKSGLITGSANNKGCNIITPFKVEDRDLIILVNRGWLPSKYKNLEERQKTHREGVMEITGTVRQNEIRPQFMPKNNPERGMWCYRDVYEMAEYTGSSPVFIDLITTQHEPDMPIGNQTRVNLRNEHLSYIITWFGLSGFTGWFWIRQFIFKRPLF